MLGADPSSDLGLHHLAAHQHDRVAQQVAVLAAHHLQGDIGSGHHPVLGHRGAPSRTTRGRADELERRGGRTLQPNPTTPATPLLTT
jgi:hypothetical protein